MATLTLNRTVAGVLTSADAVYLSDSAGVYGVRDNATGATAVAPTAAITPTSAGVYTYSDSNVLTEGSYTAVWKIVDGSNIEYFPQTFSVDALVSVPEGTTLMAIERELATRVGPYAEEVVASGTTSSAIITAFQSSLSYLTNLQDTYILRRGFKEDGTVVTGFNSADRVRVVASINTSTGAVTPDRNWAIAPTADEVVEFHHLHPTRELRKAVLEGLKRCFVYDRVAITFTSTSNERDLSSSAPWLKSIRQVKNVQVNYSSSTAIPWELWFKPFTKSGHVYVQSARDPYPNTMLVTALRPAYSYVNSSTTLAGPDDDDDVIHVDQNYAAAAAHVEAWRRFAYALTAAAQVGYQTSRKDAAAEFTRETLRWVPRLPQRHQLGQPMGYYGPELP
jgi:hypothetical protein